MTASFRLDQEPQSWFKHNSADYADIQMMTVVSTTWSQSHSAHIQASASAITSTHTKPMNGDPARLHPWPFVLVCHRQRRVWVSYHQHYKQNRWSLSQSPSARIFSKNGSHRVHKTLHPVKTRVNQLAIIKCHSDGWWHTYKRVFFIHLKGALPLRATGRWRK